MLMQEVSKTSLRIRKRWNNEHEIPMTLEISLYYHQACLTSIEITFVTRCFAALFDIEEEGKEAEESAKLTWALTSRLGAAMAVYSPNLEVRAALGWEEEITPADTIGRTRAGLESMGATMDLTIVGTGPKVETTEEESPFLIPLAFRWPRLIKWDISLSLSPRKSLSPTWSLIQVELPNQLHRTFLKLSGVLLAPFLFEPLSQKWVLFVCILQVQLKNQKVNTKDTKENK